MITFDVDNIFSKFEKVSVALKDHSLAPNLLILMSCISTVSLLGFK